MTSWHNPQWLAGLVGGPYDGGEAPVIAVPEWIAVRRRDDQRDRMVRGEFSIIGNPDPTPDGYELYRLDGFDDDSATYIYGDVDLPDRHDHAAPGRKLVTV